MSIKKFIEELAEALEARDEELRVASVEMLKNNGVVLNGLTFYRKDENVAPIFWLNKFYERFKRGELLKEHILERIIREYESLPTPNFHDLEEWMSSPAFIENITIHMVNGPRNRKMVKDRALVYYEVEGTGLIVLFYAKIPLEENSFGEVAITERIMTEYIKVNNAEELYHFVTKRIEPEEIRFESSLAVMERLLREKRIDAAPLSVIDDYLYVLSNRNLTYGAGMILSEAVKEVLLERFPSGKVIALPSSVHELLLLPMYSEDLRRLRKVVRAVNASEVELEDYLSDEIFQYDANTGKLEAICIDEDESEDA